MNCFHQAGFPFFRRGRECKQRRATRLSHNNATPYFSCCVCSPRSPVLPWRKIDYFNINIDTRYIQTRYHRTAVFNDTIIHPNIYGACLLSSCVSNTEHTCYSTLYLVQQLLQQYVLCSSSSSHNTAACCCCVPGITLSVVRLCTLHQTVPWRQRFVIRRAGGAEKKTKKKTSRSMIF